MDNEYYTVIIRLHYIEYGVYLNINGVKEKNSDEEPESKNGLKWYEITLIAVGAVIFIIIIIIIIIVIIKRKKRMTTKSIEENINDLDAVDD